MLTESEEIKKMYRDAGLKPPDGKGIHTKKFHSCVIQNTLDAKKTGKKVNPHAICMASLGKEKAVKKAHQKSESVSIRKRILEKVKGLIEQPEWSEYNKTETIKNALRNALTEPGKIIIDGNEISVEVFPDDYDVPPVEIRVDANTILSLFDTHEEAGGISLLRYVIKKVR